MKIEQRLMTGLPNYNLSAVKYIVAHESGNARNNGPDSLEKELSFMNRNKANAFVSHWVGGGGRIVQVAPVGKLQYGCGPKGNPYAYAQVELARTNDKSTFEKDYAAYVWLLRKLAKDAGLAIELDGSGKGIKTHRWITNNLGGTTHVDPYAYLASHGISEAQFKQDIKIGIIEGELSMSEAEKLQKQINELKVQLANKAPLKSNEKVGASHKDAMDWAINEGIIHGTLEDDKVVMNPAGVLTRQQMATILKRYHDKFVELLNDTGRSEIRELLKKSRDAGIIDASYHTDSKIAKYNDVELLSYQAAIVNREFK